MTAGSCIQYIVGSAAGAMWKIVPEAGAPPNGRARGSGPIHSNEYLEGSATAGTPKAPFLVSTNLTIIPYCGDWQGPAPVVTPRACVLQERDDTLSRQIPDAPAA